MTRKQIIYTLPIFIVLMGIISPNQWSILPIGGDAFTWFVSFLLIIIVLYYKKLFFHPSNISDYFLVKIYFIWVLFSTIRGAFVAENYWEWKQLINGFFSLSLPIFVYVFSIPWILRNTLKMWLKYCIPLFLIFYSWSLKRLAFHFYLGPIYILGCFLPLLVKKWRFIVGGLLVLMLFIDLGGRSQVLKALFVLMLALVCYWRHYIPIWCYKVAHWGFYILPMILLFLGISGVFNAFEDLSSNEGKYKETRIVDGKIVEEDLSADTRTALYEEVISSAILHDYWLFGRTPARGNDSETFGASLGEELGTGKYERHRNEFCFPNVFTWTGIIGMILYCLLYLKASYLAVYKSNNIFLKSVGVFIAFRFTYGWIEDFNSFSIMNISLWMVIAMGFSEKFRRMNDREFKYWVSSIVKF